MNKFLGCETAQEVWRKMEVTYKGTNKVKESKINKNLRYYELFKMEENKSISSMNARFTNIVNELKRLGKEFSEEERVKRILRSLARDCKAKKTIIEKAQDLTTYKYYELIGSLITHGILMKTFKKK